MDGHVYYLVVSEERKEFCQLRYSIEDSRIISSITDAVRASSNLKLNVFMTFEDNEAYASSLIDSGYRRLWFKTPKHVLEFLEIHNDNLDNNCD